MSRFAFFWHHRVYRYVTHEDFFQEIGQMKLQNLGFTAFSIAGSEKLPKATELVKWGAQHGMHHPQFVVKDMTDATAQALSQVCANENSQASVLALFFADDCPTKDPARAMKAVAPQLARAMILSPKHCIVVGPLLRGLGDPHIGLVNPDDIQRQREFLQLLGEHVKQYEGMEVGLEPLNRFESKGPNTVVATVGLIKDAADNLGVLLDTSHQLVEEDDPVAVWAKYGKRAPLFHLSPSGRQHLGRGSAVTSAMISQAARWNRPIVMELFGSDTPDDFFGLLGVHSKGDMTCQELFLEGMAFIDDLE